MESSAFTPCYVPPRDVKTKLSNSDPVQKAYIYSPIFVKILREYERLDPIKSKCIQNPLEVGDDLCRKLSHEAEILLIKNIDRWEESHIGSPKKNFTKNNTAFRSDLSSFSIHKGEMVKDSTHWNTTPGKRPATVPTSLFITSPITTFEETKTPVRQIQTSQTSRKHPLLSDVASQEQKLNSSPNHTHSLHSLWEKEKFSRNKRNSSKKSERSSLSLSPLRSLASSPTKLNHLWEKRRVEKVDTDLVKHLDDWNHDLNLAPLNLDSPLLRNKSIYR